MVTAANVNPEVDNAARAAAVERFTNHVKSLQACVNGGDASDYDLPENAQQLARLLLNIFVMLGGFSMVPARRDKKGEIYVMFGSPALDPNGNQRTDDNGDAVWQKFQLTDDLPRITVTEVFTDEGTIEKLPHPVEGMPSRIEFAPVAWKIGKGDRKKVGKEDRTIGRSSTTIENALLKKIATAQDPAEVQKLTAQLNTVRETLRGLGQ